MPLVLGIDVGGTKVAFALGDETGRVRAHRRRPMAGSGDPDADLDRIAEDARALLAEAGVGPEALAGVGVSLPGPLDLEAGEVLNPPNLRGWKRVPVRDRLAAALGCRVFLENDANAAALAEWHFGAGRGFEHLVYLTMSTGVGGGLVLGGRLHRGVAASAGEVGHMPIVWEGEPCVCGLRGCAEAYLGGAAWQRRLRERAPSTSRVVALAGGRARATPEHAVAAAREGDAWALEEMERYNHYLAHLLALLTFALAPQAFVLGTIAAAAGEALCLGPVRARLRAHVWPLLGDELKVLPAELGESLPDLAGLGVALEGLRVAGGEGVGGAS